MLRTREGAGPTDDASLEELERQLGRPLPGAYRKFLLTANGGRPERDLVVIPGNSESPYARIHFFFGIGDPVESCDLTWNIANSENLPPGLIPIATTEGADVFCLTPSGGVLFWDGYRHTTFPIASSFEDFLSQLYRDEFSPAIDTEQTDSFG